MKSHICFFVALAVICDVLTSTYAVAAQPVVPEYGPWEYGSNRCGVIRWGLSTEYAAVIDGGDFNYEKGCGWEVASSGRWGTREIPTNGACGSSKRYPAFSKSGIETMNTRHYLISYGFIPRVGGCTDSTAPDGLTIYRRRSTDNPSCPDGYKMNGQQCMLVGINPDKNNNICPPNGSNPIHTALGYKLQKETDYSGNAANTLKFERYYTSSGHWGQSVLGNNWSHTYARRINHDSNAYISTVSVFRPNGDRFYFTAQGDGTWLPDQDVTSKLVQLFNADSIFYGWKYIDSSNNIERYDTSGKLISITDLLGRKISFRYNIVDRLSSVADLFGQKISFTYDENGRISKMIDPSGGEYKYSYSTLNNLIQVIRPDQTIRKYHYENTSFPDALTGITDENGVRYATWVYDDEGRAISSEHANGVDKTTFSYNTDGTTTVTNPLGKQTTYHFTTIQGVRKVTQVEGHPTASCEGANKAYSYDANGNVISKTDWNGVTTTYTYDMARNLELTRTEAVGTAQERTITTEWHAQFRLPTKITEPNRITEYSYDAQGRRLSSKVSSVQ